MAEQIVPVKIYELPKSEGAAENPERAWVAVTEGSKETTARETTRKPYPVGDHEFVEDCVACDGTGMLNGQPCTICQGTGKQPNGAVSVSGDGVVSVNVDNDSIKVKNGVLVGAAKPKCGDGLKEDEDGSIAVKAGEGIAVTADGVSISLAKSGGLTTDKDGNVKIDFVDSEHASANKPWSSLVTQRAIEAATKQGGVVSMLTASASFDVVGRTNVIRLTNPVGVNITANGSTIVFGDDPVVQGANIVAKLSIECPTYDQNASEFNVQFCDSTFTIDTTKRYTCFTYADGVQKPTTYDLSFKLTGVEAGEVIPVMKAIIVVDVIGI